MLDQRDEDLQIFLGQAVQPALGFLHEREVGGAFIKEGARRDVQILTDMFGYRITRKNGIEIDPEQAEVVREMYARIIRGDTLNSIVRWLNRNGHLGAFGGKWTAGQLRAALSNEKYMGHSLLQKKYRVNHIDKTLVPNQGELPQYYATETHPAIIDEATFEAAQKALERIAAHKPASKPWEHHIFTGMII